MHHPNTSYAATLTRLTLGVALIAHAWLKIFVFTLPGTVGFFASQGFPGWSAYPVVAIELLGGVALVIGLGSRLAALAALPVLLGALFVHAGNGWLFTSPKGGWEYPAFMAATAIVVLLSGDGAFALGNLFGPRVAFKRQAA